MGYNRVHAANAMPSHYTVSNEQTTVCSYSLYNLLALHLQDHFKYTPIVDTVTSKCREKECLLVWTDQIELSFFQSFKQTDHTANWTASPNMPVWLHFGNRAYCCTELAIPTPAVLAVPSHGGMARLSWPVAHNRLTTCQDHLYQIQTHYQITSGIQHII